MGPAGDPGMPLLSRGHVRQKGIVHSRCRMLRLLRRGDGHRGSAKSSKYTLSLGLGLGLNLCRRGQLDRLGQTVLARHGRRRRDGRHVVVGRGVVAGDAEVGPGVGNLPLLLLLLLQSLLRRLRPYRDGGGGRRGSGRRKGCGGIAHDGNPFAFLATPGGR